MGMSMCGVIPGKDGFVDRLMRGMRERVVKRMMPGILQVTIPVHTRPPFGKQGGFRLLL
jgi:hypothetical protein